MYQGSNMPHFTRTANIYTGSTIMSLGCIRLSRVFGPYRGRSLSKSSYPKSHKPFRAQSFSSVAQKWDANQDGLSGAHSTNPNQGGTDWGRQKGPFLGRWGLAVAGGKVSYLSIFDMVYRFCSNYLSSCCLYRNRWFLSGVPGSS